ncbi:hypothetical protein KIH87_05785 [Paraneptunicella aestuarii]|uniref:hypothetical protein n=1 Tax=Paraneptunicella aestuarii TaxID=2831148 RepID=UPI001E4C28CA|nr:hypothetical protein [Paraneptunicella aestuarii]UAA39864.1 hypothetical protein KIH87_05785 [Paraneptunicella aestuarii]
MSRLFWISFFLIGHFLFWPVITQAEEEEVETDFVFADFQLDNRKTGVELDLATRDYEQFYLLLDTFNEQFVSEFVCDVAEGASSGELNGLFWDGAVSVPLEAEKYDYFIQEGDCYINIHLLDALEVRYRFDEHRQIFAILTEGRHPKTKAIKLAARKEMLAKLKEKKSASLEVPDHYYLGTPPVLDISANDRWQNNQHRLGTYVQSVFDLLYHQTEAQLNWNKGDALRGRAKMSRKIPWGGDRLHYQMGDIQSGRQSLFNLPSRGLGFSLGERQNVGQRDSMDLSGYTQPFSEVELYKDDLLVDFIALGEAGFYEFKNVDFKEQSTQYKIRITSPEGDVTEEWVQSPGEHGLTAGEWSPGLIYLDSSQALFEEVGGNRSGRLMAADVRYALSAERLVTLGVEYKDNPFGQSLVYGTAGDRDLWGWHADVKLGYADTWLYHVNVGTQLDFLFGKHNVTFSSNKLQNDDNLSQSHSVNWGFQWQDVNLNWSASKSILSDNQSLFQTLELGYKTQQWSLSLQGQQTDNERFVNQEDTQANGEDGTLAQGAQVSDKTQHRSFSVVGSANGDFGNLNVSFRRDLGAFGQRAFDLSYSKRFHGINAGLSFRWDLAQNTRNTSLKLSHRFDAFRLNGSVGYNDTSGWSVGLGISFGLLSHSPFSSLSSVSALRTSEVEMTPFLDLNGNAQWDSDEDFLPQVSLKERNKTFRKQVAENKIKLYGVDAYNPKLFTVDDSELENPFIMPTYSDIRLESHPGGKVNIAIPFQVHYELEGEIQLFDAAGEQKDRVGQVPLHLYKLNEADPLFIKTYYSEPDGFYVLDKIKAGRYRLVVDSEFMQNKSVACTLCEWHFDTQNAVDYILYADVIALTSLPERKGR